VTIYSSGSRTPSGPNASIFHKNVYVQESRPGTKVPYIYEEKANAWPSADSVVPVEMSEPVDTMKYA
jgi:hypothetical protein